MPVFAEEVATPQYNPQRREAVRLYCVAKDDVGAFKEQERSSRLPIDPSLQVIAFEELEQQENPGFVLVRVWYRRPSGAAP